jgi:hypothetical protein
VFSRYAPRDLATAQLRDRDFHIRQDRWCVILALSKIETTS